MSHKFAIGQAVDLMTTVLRPAASGAYEIKQLMPASDSDPANPTYRIKNLVEKHERVVRQSEITLSGTREAVFS